MGKLKSILSDNRMLSLLGGIFYASAFPMKNEIQFLPGTLIGFGLFYHCIKSELSASNENNIKRSLMIVLSFSLGYYLLGYYWIPETLREFGNIPRPINYLLGLFFSIFIIPQYIAFALLYNLKSKFVFITNQTSKNILLAIVLTLLEYWFPQQFPAHLGHPAFSLRPFLGLVPIFGAPLFSFMGYWTIFTIYNFVFLKEQKKRVDHYYLAVLILFILANVVSPLTDESDKKTFQSKRNQIGAGQYWESHEAEF